LIIEAISELFGRVHNANSHAGSSKTAQSPTRDQKLIHVIDGYNLPEFTAVAKGYGQDCYGYVVTPNVDHLVRYFEDASFRERYRAADFILMDSRFAAVLVRLLKGTRVPICTGSDLTAQLLKHVVQSTDRVVIIGGTLQQAQFIASEYSLLNFRHHNPPMGFIQNPTEVEQCLEFIEDSSPFRFCFLAVGSPQQEALANDLLSRGRARGLALCVGASLNFLTGSEKRAPLWMQRLALEWLYRLLKDPRRLAGRYLARGPRIFSQLLRSQFIVRGRPRPPHDESLRPQPGALVNAFE
jgi:exopolysaccharide biosynthesis WecB/TagA/CpsF family protein